MIKNGKDAGLRDKKSNVVENDVCCKQGETTQHYSVSVLTKDLLVVNSSVFSIWGLFVISVCVFDRMCVLAAGVRECVG